MRPQAFEASGEFGPDYWSIDPLARVPAPDPDAPDLWHFDPRLAVRACDLDMVRLWLWCARFTENGPEMARLPQAGGVLDQAAIMMDAFAALAGGDAAWRRDFPAAST